LKTNYPFFPSTILSHKHPSSKAKKPICNYVCVKIVQDKKANLNEGNAKKMGILSQMRQNIPIIKEDVQGN
jgi:hypothetical protein